MYYRPTSDRCIPPTDTTLPSIPFAALDGSVASISEQITFSGNLLPIISLDIQVRIIIVQKQCLLYSPQSQIVYDRKTESPVFIVTFPNLTIQSILFWTIKSQQPKVLLPDVLACLSRLMQIFNSNLELELREPPVQHCLSRLPWLLLSLQTCYIMMMHYHSDYQMWFYPHIPCTLFMHNPLWLFISTTVMALCTQ